MGKKVIIVGIGPGSKEFMLPVAIDTLKKSDHVIGFNRAVEALKFLDREITEVKSLKEIISFIDEKQGIIAVAASGDPCFYGVTEYLKNKLQEDTDVIPGLSSFQYLISKLKKSWSNAFLGSLHGRKGDFINKVKQYQLSIWLTDKEHSPKILSEMLLENAVNVRLYVGENLSYEDERIVEGSPHEMKFMDFTPLSVVVVERIE